MTRYQVQESRIRPGTFNVVDTKRVIAVVMGADAEKAAKEAERLNGAKH